MVDPALQAVIATLTLEERMELMEYIESAVDGAPVEVSEAQQVMIRSRAAESDADPSIGLTWDELDTRMGARWR